MRESPRRARERFLGARVARLATADAAAVPHLVPVTFACVTRGADDVLVFAVDHKPKSTTRLRRLANIAANPAVCLLVDEYDDDWSRLWWARADGRAALLGGEQRDQALAALQDRYEQYQQQVPAGPVVGATVTRWSGWSAGPAAAVRSLN
jgi:PPOX class probable F420-dependent enzyme